MKRRMICFEGIDGAGKRTQSQLLVNALIRTGKKAKLYSYPDYDSPYGKVIRAYLDGKQELGRKEHFLLFLADILKDKEQMKKEMNDGFTLILDRYFYTALAYICPSGLKYAKASSFAKRMNFIKSHCVIYLDIPVSMTKNRKKMQGKKLDKFEKNAAFLEDVRGFYEKMARSNYGSRWIRIDARKSVNEVHEKVISCLK